MIERRAVISANDTTPPPSVTPPSAPIHPSPQWPTGITEEQARTICQASILQSAAFALCSNFTVQSLEVITASCMLDLQVATVMPSSENMFVAITS